MTQRITLRFGARGKTVETLQNTLNRVLEPSPHLTVDGNFGKQTLSAIKRFQAESDTRPDGIVGARSWEALDHAKASHSTDVLPQFRLADIAATFIGVSETGNNHAGKSAKMLEIFQADNLVINGHTDGYPWCAAFVSLCVQLLCKQSLYYASLVPPREASVSRFLHVWAKHQKCLIFAPTSQAFKPIKGDIVVFTFSHIGIVESGESSLITTIEGNTNDAGSREGIKVARKKRPTSIIRAFIRLPMTETGVTNTLPPTISALS